MKPSLIALAAFALVTTFVARAETYSFKESFDKAGPFNPTGAVVLHNVNGAVEIRAWDKNEIRISGEKSAETEEELKAIELTIDQTPDRAVVKVELPKRNGGWFGSGGTIRANVRFSIFVPATAKLERIDSVNGGIDIAGIRGSVRASSVNGHVKAIDIGGSTRLSTVNGAVEARIPALTPGMDVKADTTNGGITLALPADAAARLDASTVNGGITCDFPVEVSGRFVGRSMHGTVGGGGAEVKATTVNGGIKIRKI